MLVISFCVADYKLVDREDFPVVAECFWNAEAMEVNAWSVYDSRGAFSKYVRSICASSYGGVKHRTEHLRIMARWSFNGNLVSLKRTMLRTFFLWGQTHSVRKQCLKAVKLLMAILKILPCPLGWGGLAWFEMAGAKFVKKIKVVLSFLIQV